MIKKIIFALFLLFSTLYSVNSVNAIKIERKDVPRIVNEVVQTFDRVKKAKILNKPAVKNFLLRFNSIYINAYVYNTITTKKYNNYNIITDMENKDKLVFQYNRFNMLNKSLLKAKKEEIRDFMIKELFDRGLLNIDEDIQGYYVDTNLQGGLFVKRNNIQINKEDILGKQIDKIFQNNAKNFKYLTTDYDKINRNIYYNYLFNNSISKVAVFEIDWENLSKTLIIRNVNDYYKLFKVTSYRYRSGYRYDPSYRKYNIAQIYNTIKGNKMVLYPKQTISFNEIYLKGDNGKKFKKGSIIMDGKAKHDVYGGGVCGAATGMYQGSLYNKNIKSTARPHSIWYNMYRASINGKKIYTPGLDATYYTNVIDFRMTNTGKYPIVLVNRIVDNIEENFTISLKYEEKDKITGIKFNNRVKNCFYWTIDGKTKRSCYKEIASETAKKKAEEERKAKLKKEKR